jgi:hypothetical protein
MIISHYSLWRLISACTELGIWEFDLLEGLISHILLNTAIRIITIVGINSTEVIDLLRYIGRVYLISNCPLFGNFNCLSLWVNE